MHIYCTGLNHLTADVSLRERLAFSMEKAKAALARFGCGSGAQSGSITELVILSTCNRVEIYSVAAHLDPIEVEIFLAETQEIDREIIHPHLYHYEDEKAAAHLFRVAAGLDSLVLGEPQILGQVMSALELARSQGATGAVLTKLFQSALHTGKRARSETAISQNPASISSVTARLAERVFKDLRSTEVAILGAGEMAELAVEALRKRGVNRIRVINRTIQRAQTLANRWGAEAGTFEKIPEILSQADILIASTSAPHHIILTEQVSQAMENRHNANLLIIDIAVPRNVEIQVGGIPGVSLIDMDTLQDHLESSLARREREIPEVEKILEEEVSAFSSYLRTLEVIPLIAELQQQAESIRRAELNKTLRRLSDLTPEEQQRLDIMTHALVKKILHNPISRLRKEANSSAASEYAATTRQLFGLLESPEP
jgi:glutamyl-tRNA reductase